MVTGGMSCYSNCGRATIGAIVEPKEKKGEKGKKYLLTVAHIVPYGFGLGYGYILSRSPGGTRLAEVERFSYIQAGNPSSEYIEARIKEPNCADTGINSIGNLNWAPNSVLNNLIEKDRGDFYYFATRAGTIKLIRITCEGFFTADFSLPVNCIAVNQVNPPAPCMLKDVLVVVPSKGCITQPGDSGAFLLTDDDRQTYVLGMYACRSLPQVSFHPPSRFPVERFPFNLQNGGEIRLFRSARYTLECDGFITDGDERKLLEISEDKEYRTAIRNLRQSKVRLIFYKIANCGGNPSWPERYSF